MVSPLLPNNLAKVSAKELQTDGNKLFLVLRWMVKILDYPFYQKLKSSFQGLYASEPKIGKMKTEALGNMLGQTASRLRSPELAEYTGLLTVKGLDLVKTLKEYHVFHGKSPEEFISSCQSGELLADLVNTLEGKEEKIKGIVKKPKSLTSKSANIIKVLRYLRNFPKIPNTYIWDEKAILEGDLSTIKGLIFDILAFYKKIPRTSSLSQTKGSLLLSPSLNTNSPKLLMQKPQLGKRSQKAKIIDPREYKMTYAEEMPERVIELSEDSKERVSEWLVSLDLAHLIVNPSGDFTGDNFRNGVILCELAGLIEGKQGFVRFSQPRTLSEARENIEIAFAVIRNHDRGVPVSLLSNPNRVITGDMEAVWGLLCHIMLAYPALASVTPKIVFKDIPYSPDAIQELEESLLAFILSKGVLDRTRVPGSFQELLPDIVSGVLLCDLVSRVAEKTICGVFRSPTTQNLALSNIKKALTPLRTLRRMGMKYVWAEEEILKGNFGVILGLLEDLHLYSDGMPPRQRGPQYHKDGPYFGRPLQAYQANKSLQKLNISISTEIDKFNSPHSKLIHSNSEYNKSENFLEDPNFQGFSWLLKIGVTYPAGLNLTLDLIPEFKTGEILCDILGRLERQAILGLHTKISNQAACLHNLGKAFGVLRTKPGFPSYLCFVEEEIFKGDGDVIRAVLSEIYKIYRRTINALKGFNNRKLALE